MLLLDLATERLEGAGLIVLNRMHVKRPLANLVVDGMTVSLWPRAPYESRGEDEQGLIGFAFDTQDGVDAIASDKSRAFLRRANTVSWVPPTCSVYSASREGGEYLVIANVEAAAIGHRSSTEQPLNGVVDTDAVIAGHTLRRLLLSGSSGEARPALDLLVATLLRSFAPDAKQLSFTLTNARLSAVDRLIESRMHERLEVADLANELGLSVGYLVIAFRQSLGTTPHRYLMDRRLARARKLLAGQESIATIATACGFADQAHLTRSLAKAFGITPARYKQKRGYDGPCT